MARPDPSERTDSTEPGIQPRRATALRSVAENYLKTLDPGRAERRARAAESEKERLEERYEQRGRELSAARDEIARLNGLRESEMRELMRLRKKEKQRASEKTAAETRADTPILRVEERGQPEPPGNKPCITPREYPVPPGAIA